MESQIASPGYDVIYAHQYFTQLVNPSAKVKEIIEALEAKVLADLKAYTTAKQS